MATSDTDSLNELYQSWLGIPAERLPPNHYALLGLDDFESDVLTIEQAAKQRGAYLHQIAAGPQRKAVQKLLGQVALAKRTLLDDLAKTGYDESLRNPLPTVSKNAVANGLPAAPRDVTPKSSISPQQADSQKRSAAGKSASMTTAASFAEQRRKKKKANVWKFHAISAGVLLSIVAVVWLVYGGGGGRRAAQVGDVQSATQKRPPTVSSESKSKNNRPNNVVAKQSPKPKGKVRANATASKQPAATSTAPRNRKPKRGAAIQRSQGSGLLAGNGAVSNFLATNMKGDNAEPTESGNSDPPSKPIDITPPTSEEPDSDKPVSENTAPVKPSPKGVFELPDGWTNGQKVAKSFPAQLKRLFELGKKDDPCYLVKDGKLVIAAAKKKPVRQRLTRKSADLVGGSLVSVRVNLTKDVKQNQVFGLTVGDRLIGIRPGKGKMVVFHQKVGDPSSSKDLKTIDFAQAFSFGVMRPGKQDKLRWVIDGPKADHTGVIDNVKMEKKAKYAIFFNAPEDLSPASISFSQLRNGKLKNPPSWK